MHRMVLLALAVGGWPVWAAAQEDGRRVTVTGRAAGATAVAEEEAKVDALREAVRRVCATFINAQTEVEDFAVIRDKILEQPVGFARIVKILRGPEVISGDITEVQLVAEVFPAQFEKKWAEFAHIKQREGNPRCVVVIVEDDDVDDDRPPVVNGLVQAEIENFFLSKQVQLMDQGTTDAVKSRDLELAATSGDLKKAAAVGHAFNADVVVLGAAEAKRAEPITVGGQTLRRWVVSLTIRVVQADSGALLVSRTYRPEKPVSSSSGTSRPALVNLARESAEACLADIAQAWRERATVSRIVQVRLEPCTRGQFKAIQDEAIKLKGVNGGKDGFKLRELVNEVALGEVDWKYGLNELADRLEEMAVEQNGQRLSMEVTEQSANRLSLRLKARTAVGGASLPSE